VLPLYVYINVAQHVPLQYYRRGTGGGIVLDMELAGAQLAADSYKRCINSHMRSRVIESIRLTVRAEFAIILTSTTH
jgi:hypothetical protein